MAQPRQPDPNAPYEEWRDYVQQLTGFKGTKLTGATRAAMQQAGRGGTRPEPGEGPGEDPAPGYKWVWNGFAWIETPLGKEEKPTQEPPTGYEWVWNETTQRWESKAVTTPETPEEAKDRQSAYDTLQAWFKYYGIDDESPTPGEKSLSTLISEWLADDKSPDWIKLELRMTKQYQARFPGMQALSSKGLAMSEAEYIATERAYLQVLSAAGLEGVYGNRSDYGRFIASEVSAQELASRVQIAKDYVQMYAPKSVKDQLRALYGMDETQMTAYMLDTSEGKKKSLSFLESEYTRRVSQARVGGAAVDSGLSVGSALRDQIAEMGYDYNQSAAGFSRASVEAKPYERLGELYGVQTSTDELIRENFGLGGGAEVTTKKKKLASRERAAFSGSGGVAQGSLAASRVGRV